MGGWVWAGGWVGGWVLAASLPVLVHLPCPAASEQRAPLTKARRAAHAPVRAKPKPGRSRSRA